ncbi:MAG: phospholipid carrier-dependent glycosyltransferase [Candidatus Dormibacteraceae bacterium]
MKLERADLWIVLWFFTLALALRFFSPIMLTSPANGLITNCVHSTPVDAAGHLGTLCGLAYPYQMAGSDGTPARGEVFDEIHFADAAHGYLKGLGCLPDYAEPGLEFCDPEPPLAKELIAAGEWGDGKWRQLTEGARGDPADLGFNTFGWRIMVCIFGSLVVPLMYLLAFGLWPNRWFAATAAFLCCLDGMFFVQSRIAMLDIFPIFFIMLSYTLFLFHLRSQRWSSSLLTLMLTGIALGLAISTKWIALAALASIGFFLAARVGLTYLNRERRSVSLPENLPGNVPPTLYIGTAAMALLAIPAAVYTLSWLPFFFWGRMHSLGDLVSYQFQLYDWLASFTGSHPFASKWYTWPFLYRPVLYYSGDLGLDGYGQSLVAKIIDLGNPIIWWASILAILSLPYFLFKKRSWAAAVILVGFITQYFPFVRVIRMTFLYYMFGALIFMILALAFVLARIHQSEGKIFFRWPGLAERVSVQKLVLPGFLILTVLFFSYFYPIWSGEPLGNSDWLSRMWFPSWM